MRIAMRPHQKRHLVMVAGFLFAFALVYFSILPQKTSGFVSSEVHFADASLSGLSIVPASCPSTPDYAGECDDPPVQGGAYTCALSANRYSVSQGQSATLRWTSNGGDSHYISGGPGQVVGSVGPTGSAQVTPTVDTTYVMSGRYDACDKNGCSSTYYYCDATITVAGASCPSGQTMSGGTCVCTNGLNISSYPSCTCPAGQLQSGSSCVGGAGLQPPASLSASCSTDGTQASLSWPSASGATGYFVRVNNVANPYAPTRCDNGPDDGNVGDYCSPVITSTGYNFASIPDATYYAWVHSADSGGNSPGYADVSFTCSSTGTMCSNGLNINLYPSCLCPAGQHQNGSSCVADNCPNGLDINLYPACTCPAGKVVSGSRCVFPPPSASLKVTPLLVRRNQTVNAEWSSRNVDSCTLTSTNADSWNTINGTGVSRPIVAQTVFTLTCLGLDGTTVTAKQTVRILPYFEEVCDPGFHHDGGVCVPD